MGERREGIEDAEHASDAAVEDGVIGVDPIRKIFFDERIDPSEPQAFLGDVVLRDFGRRGKSCGGEKDGDKRKRPDERGSGFQSFRFSFRNQYNLDAGLRWRGNPPGVEAHRGVTRIPFRLRHVGSARKSGSICVFFPHRAGEIDTSQVVMVSYAFSDG